MHGSAIFTVGDYVKFEVRDERTGESEWMWLKVDSVDERQRIVLGTLDSLPVVFAATMKVGQRLAVGYDKVREHRKHDENW